MKLRDRLTEHRNDDCLPWLRYFVSYHTEQDDVSTEQITLSQPIGQGNLWVLRMLGAKSSPIWPGMALRIKVSPSNM